MEEDLCRGCCIHSFQQSFPKEQHVTVDVSDLNLTSYRTSLWNTEIFNMKYDALQQRESLLVAQRKKRQIIEEWIGKCQTLLKQPTVPQYWRCEYENRLKAITNQMTFSKTNYSDTTKYAELERCVAGIHKVIQECTQSNNFPIIPFSPLMISNDYNCLIETNENQSDKTGIVYTMSYLMSMFH